MNLNQLKKLAGLPHEFEAAADHKVVRLQVEERAMGYLLEVARSKGCKVTKAGRGRCARVSGTNKAVEECVQLLASYVKVTTARTGGETLTEGFMDLSVVGSDSASNLMYEISSAAAGVLKKGLKAKGNKYNTPGYLNVAMIITEYFAEQEWHEELHAVAKLALAEMKKNEAAWNSNKDYWKILVSLEKFVEAGV